MDNKEQAEQFDQEGAISEPEITTEEKKSTEEQAPVEEPLSGTVPEQSGDAVEPLPLEEELPVELAPEQPVNNEPGFNCPECKGSGLIVTVIMPDGKICGRCNGTGKVT